MPIFIAILCILLAGCATITKGRYQEIKINSNVAGALVELDGVKLGYTPFKGKVKRGSVGKIKVSKAGYSAGTIQIQRKRSDEANMLLSAPSVVGGVILGGTLGVMSAGEGGSSGGGGELGRMTESTASTTYPLFGTSTGALIGLIAGAGSSALGTSIDDITSAAWEYSPSQYYVELKQNGRSGLDFINDVAVRYFATVNHSQIAIDAGKSDGEYVNALAGLMKSKTNEEIAKQSINEALEKSRGDQVLFGDALVERLGW